MTKKLVYAFSGKKAEGKANTKADANATDVIRKLERNLQPKLQLKLKLQLRVKFEDQVERITMFRQSRWTYTHFEKQAERIKTVENLDMAISHITKYGSKHSEAIITKNQDSAKYFIDKVDASAVFHNTSTRFNDGFELGLGAEVAVSTDKLHARGPMGINDLMTYKWVVLGEGQIRT